MIKLPPQYVARNFVILKFPVQLNWEAGKLGNLKKIDSYRRRRIMQKA
jgi:hypothetical protein